MPVLFLTRNNAKKIYIAQESNVCFGRVVVCLLNNFLLGKRLELNGKPYSDYSGWPNVERLLNKVKHPFYI